VTTISLQHFLAAATVTSAKRRFKASKHYDV